MTLGSRQSIPPGASSSVRCVVPDPVLFAERRDEPGTDGMALPGRCGRDGVRRIVFALVRASPESASSGAAGLSGIVMAGFLLKFPAPLSKRGRNPEATDECA